MHMFRSVDTPHVGTNGGETPRKTSHACGAPTEWTDVFGFRLKLSVRQRRKYELRAKMAAAHWDVLIAKRGRTEEQFRQLLGGASLRHHANGTRSCRPDEDVVDLVQRHGVAASHRRKVWRVWVRCKPVMRLCCVVLCCGGLVRHDQVVVLLSVVLQAHIDEAKRTAEHAYDWYTSRLQDLPIDVIRQIEVGACTTHSCGGQYAVRVVTSFRLAVQTWNERSLSTQAFAQDSLASKHCGECCKHMLCSTQWWATCRA